LPIWHRFYHENKRYYCFKTSVWHLIVVVKWYSLVLATWQLALGRGSIPRGDISFCYTLLSSLDGLFSHTAVVLSRIRFALELHAAFRGKEAGSEGWAELDTCSSSRTDARCLRIALRRVTYAHRPQRHA
jgi:hypothetical protein